MYAVCYPRDEDEGEDGADEYEDEEYEPFDDDEEEAAA
jgi:hypothetical protein